MLLDELAQVLERLSLVVDELSRGAGSEWVGEHELPGEGEEIALEGAPQSGRAVVVGLREHVEALLDGAGDRLPVEAHLGVGALYEVPEARGVLGNPLPHGGQSLFPRVQREEDLLLDLPRFGSRTPRTIAS